MAGRWCLHQKYLLPFPWKMFAAIQTISLAGGGGGGIVVFTYLNVSDSTHSRQDSVIDGIKVEKERERGVS